MVKAIEKDKGYKEVLKHKYETLVALASKKGVVKSDETKTDAFVWCLTMHQPLWVIIVRWY